MSIAGSTRIGNLVGMGLIRLTTLRIMFWYFFAFLLSALLNVALGCGVLLLMLRYLIHDEEVARIVSDNLPYMLIFAFWSVKFETLPSPLTNIVQGRISQLAALCGQRNRLAEHQCVRHLECQLSL